MGIPGIVDQHGLPFASPILDFLSPVDGDKSGTGFDQAATKQCGLAVSITPLGVAKRIRFAIQIKSLMNGWLL